MLKLNKRLHKREVIIPMKRLSPMSDVVFKAMFGRENAVSNRLLLQLINDILTNKGDEPVVSIECRNPFHYPEYPYDKEAILDIKAESGTGERFNIEVQVKREDAYRQRSLFYWAKTYCETIAKGESYDELKKTVVINIVGYDAIAESDYMHTHFKIMEKDEHFPLTEDLQIHYLELPKLSSHIQDVAVERWMAFFKNADNEAADALMEQLAENSEIIKEAKNMLEKISADEKMQELYRAREKARLDEINRIRSAEKRGEERGEERGKKRNAKQIAENLFRMGIPFDTVQKAAEILSHAELTEIQQQVLGSSH